MTEIIKPDSNLPDQNKKFDLDTFKSIYYWANAKPDTQVKFFRKKKEIELSDIYDLNERVEKKLQTHNIETYVVHLNFILTEGNIKEYSSLEEFKRENWDTINQRIESINLTWDLTFSLRNFAIPQRHTLKVRIGNAIAPKDMFQLMFTSDEPSELMESRAEGLVKVDFINQVVANELINIVSNWQKGLNDVSKPKSMISFLMKKENLIRLSIIYITPIIFLTLFYQYHQLLFQKYSFSKEINILSVQKLAIIYMAIFGFALLIAKYFSSWLGRKIDKLKKENGITITKGDKNYILEINKKNKSILSQIAMKLFISLLVTIILIVSKFIISQMGGSI